MSLSNSKHDERVGGHTTHLDLHPVAVKLEKAVVRVSETQLVQHLLFVDSGGEVGVGGLDGAAMLKSLDEEHIVLLRLSGLIIARVNLARRKKYSPCFRAILFEIRLRD